MSHIFKQKARIKLILVGHAASDDQVARDYESEFTHEIFNDKNEKIQNDVFKLLPEDMDFDFEKCKNGEYENPPESEDGESETESVDEEEARVAKLTECEKLKSMTYQIMLSSCPHTIDPLESDPDMMGGLIPAKIKGKRIKGGTELFSDCLWNG